MKQYTEHDPFAKLEPKGESRALLPTPTLVSLQRVVEKVSETDVPVLVAGEPGTGKRAIALRLHETSRRRESGFQEIPASLLRDDAEARFRKSDAATAYLCDVADLNLAAQRTLLRLYFESANRERLPRLIMGTCCNLEQAVRTRRMREDFYYAISSVCLKLPPLRYRRDDVLALADHFLGFYADRFGRPKPVPTEDAIRFIREYAWPGNIAELETAMKTLVAIGDEAIALAALRASALRTKGHTHKLQTTTLKEAARAASLEVERELIHDVLISTGWNRKRAAKQLQISYKALLYKLKQIGISNEVPASSPGEFA